MVDADSAEYQVDKRLVRDSFNSAAAGYDRAAVLQKNVEAEALQRLELISHKPTRILDLGCGPGRASQALLKKYRKSEVVTADIAPAMLHLAKQKKRWFKAQRFVCLDGEQLPFAANSFDLIFSNLMFQWVNDLDQLFAGLARSLRPNGLLLFTTFGPDTLKELRQSWRQVDDYIHVNSFIDMHDIGDAMVRAGFEAPVLDMENFTLTYEKLTDLARDLKTIGAHNLTDGRRRGLTGRQRWRALEEAYEAFRENGRLPASYEVVFAHAWKPVSNEAGIEGPAESVLKFHPRRQS